ncbi:MAG: hypothetical protein IIB12_03845 [Chloroflexi bacterium]|nr:hypothetical protein [Chloroflexota bacterium]
MSDIPWEVMKVIDALLGQDALYTTIQVFTATPLDPPEYMDYCKLCGASEREHATTCLFYPLWMVI